MDPRWSLSQRQHAEDSGPDLSEGLAENSIEAALLALLRDSSGVISSDSSKVPAPAFD
jgi:hypothetical protein